MSAPTATTTLSSGQSKVKDRLKTMMKQASEPQAHDKLLTPEALANKVGGIAQHPPKAPPPTPRKDEEEEEEEDDEDLLACLSVAPASPKKTAVEVKKKLAPPPPPPKKKNKFILDEAEGSDEAEEDPEGKDLDKYDSEDSLIASENSIDHLEVEEEEDGTPKKRKPKSRVPKAFAEQDAAKEARVDAVIKKYAKGEVVGRKQIAEVYGLKGVGKIVATELSDAENEDEIRERDKNAMLGEEEEDEEEKLDHADKLPETRHSSASASSHSDDEENEEEGEEEEEEEEKDDGKAKADEYDVIEFSKEEEEEEEEEEEKKTTTTVANSKKAKISRQEVVASVVTKIETRIKDAFPTLVKRIALVKSTIENFVEAVYQATLQGEASTDAGSARSRQVLEMCTNLMEPIARGMTAIQDKAVEKLDLDDDSLIAAMSKQDRNSVFYAFAAAFFRMQIVSNVKAAVGTRCIASGARISKGDPMNVLLLAHRVLSTGPSIPTRPTIFYYPLAILSSVAPPLPPTPSASTKGSSAALQQPPVLAEDPARRLSPVEPPPPAAAAASKKTLSERLAQGNSVVVIRDLNDFEYWINAIQYYIDQKRFIEIGWKKASESSIVSVFFDDKYRPIVNEPQQPWPKLTTEQLTQYLFEILPPPSKTSTEIAPLSSVSTPQTGQLYYRIRPDTKLSTVASVGKGMAKLNGDLLAFLLSTGFDGPSVVVHRSEAILENPAVQMMHKNLIAHSPETFKLFEPKPAADQPDFAPKGTGNSGAARRRFILRLFCQLFGHEIVKPEDGAPKPQF